MLNRAAGGGIRGRILRLNLSEGKILKEDLSLELFQDYIGARGLGAKFLFAEVPKGIDPLSPQNKLIFMTGPVEGTLAPGSNKITVTFKSPLTKTYSVANCGGHFAPELKFAGYDGIIIEGKSDTPVYLWIDDENVEIRDARHLWGKLTHQIERAIKKELGDESIEVACIGPAGERLTNIACIQADFHREFGRGGAGAVMGSKNLKAIALRGTGSIEVVYPDILEEQTKKVYSILATHSKAQARRKYGTPEMVRAINDLGFWSTRNFREGIFEGSHKVDGEAMREKIVVADRSCYACSVACGKISYIRTGPYAGIRLEGPEFESLGLLGPNCGISSIEAIAKASLICDLYGIDTISMGNIIAFAMECFEKGIITKKDTKGLELTFGNEEAFLKMAEMIAKREGLGDLLAQGVKVASEKLGVEDLAMQVKGLEIPTYDPRGCKGMGITYATAARGACHMKSPTMGLEIAGDRLAITGKAKLVKDTQILMAIVDSMALCSTMRFALPLEEQLKLFSAVTGFKMDKEEVLEAGERILNLERAYNVREGFSRKDDSLPKRFLQEPMPDGPSKGQVVELEPMLNEYYNLMGWDEEGKPTVDKLRELNLNYIAESLYPNR